MDPSRACYIIEHNLLEEGFLGTKTFLNAHNEKLVISFHTYLYTFGDAYGNGKNPTHFW
jgi:hypothetical protein